MISTQETTFLKLPGGVTRFEMEQGTLSLRTGDGRSIKAHRGRQAGSDRGRRELVAPGLKGRGAPASPAARLLPGLPFARV